VALIGVGGLRTPDMALEAYNSQMADFVAIGLGVLVNPNFVTLIETGKENKARKIPNIFRNAACHQLPEPMWDQMMTFVPKGALRFATIVGKLLGWK
jgi:2,4-dienoyl-CoA reductase-like NADH-dependent reductase (Old Yellow Enzyme family)